MSNNVLSKKEEEFISKIMIGGVKYNEAKCLLIIAKEGNIKSRDIEKELKLRQPEVSIAVKSLRGRGWVEKNRQKKEGKGRPIHVYNLNKSIKEIVQEINMKIEDKIEKLKEDERRLKELTIDLFY